MYNDSWAEEKILAKLDWEFVIVIHEYPLLFCFSSVRIFFFFFIIILFCSVDASLSISFIRIFLQTNVLFSLCIW